MINYSDLHNTTLLNTTRVDGLYPIDESQLRTLLSRRDVRRSSDRANSSYFTVKLDNLGELVYYWHLVWKHASKQLMIDTVKNNIFDDLPKALTVGIDSTLTTTAWDASARQCLKKLCLNPAAGYIKSANVYQLTSSTGRKPTCPAIVTHSMLWISVATTQRCTS